MKILSNSGHVIALSMNQPPISSEELAEYLSHLTDGERQAIVELLFDETVPVRNVYHRALREAIARYVARQAESQVEKSIRSVYRYLDGVGV